MSVEIQNAAYSDPLSLTNMKLTVLIPTYTVRTTLCTMALENARRWKEQCDELIITEDGGGLCLGLHGLADLYINHPNMGVCNNMRLAWEIALLNGADYVLIADSDVALLSGNLRDMCIPGRVTVPLIRQFPNTAFTAPMLCVPRTVSDERGVYSDGGGEWRMTQFDTEYAKRIRDLVQKVDSVVVSHRGGATRFENV